MQQQEITNEPRNVHEEIELAIQNGQFTFATKLILEYLDDDMISGVDRQKYSFELERLKRVQADFTKTPLEVQEYIKTYYSEVSAEDMQRWDNEKSLEYKIIDGEKRYFSEAARNLFRIDEEMRHLWKATHPEEKITSGSGAALDLDLHNESIIESTRVLKQPYAEPKRLRIRQSLEVRPDVVPEGELIRCWLPYPREIELRQDAIDLIESQPNQVQIAPSEALQRTAYLERRACAGQSTCFSIEYELTTKGIFHDIDPEKVIDIKDREACQPFLQEVSPHIVFTDALRNLSKRIVGNEKNPYRIAQLLFAWVYTHTPWASAREYSSIRCIPEYVLEHKHGDCGIQTLFFISLCRLNGIPARWQSGWELQPPDDSMHDWGMIYFEPYGWVPMDITYGLRKSTDPALRWFYLSGMDSFRIIFNDEISQPFTPSKRYERSETVDNQRGEVEWAGGNLYFDKWRWKFEWSILDTE